MNERKHSKSGILTKVVRPEIMGQIIIISYNYRLLTFSFKHFSSLPLLLSPFVISRCQCTCFRIIRLESIVKNIQVLICFSSAISWGTLRVCTQSVSLPVDRWCVRIFQNSFIRLLLSSMHMHSARWTYICISRNDSNLVSLCSLYQCTSPLSVMHRCIRWKRICTTRDEEVRKMPHNSYGEWRTRYIRSNWCFSILIKSTSRSIPSTSTTYWLNGIKKK